jgi:DNA-binding transcriptional MerR regulator
MMRERRGETEKIPRNPQISSSSVPSSYWKVYNASQVAERHRSMREAALKIGEVARLVDMPAKTLRYYEEIGLISPAGRTDSGYRFYGWRELEQIGFVRRAKLMGLSLDQIRSLVQSAEDGIPNRVFQRLDHLLDRKLEETERRMEELRAFRETLLEYREQAAEAGARGACRCGARGSAEFCGCVAAATDGVTPPDLRVIQENSRFVKKVEESERCRCGCCKPVSGGVV